MVTRNCSFGWRDASAPEFKNWQSALAFCRLSTTIFPSFAQICHYCSSPLFLKHDATSLPSQAILSLFLRYSQPLVSFFCCSLRWISLLSFRRISAHRSSRPAVVHSRYCIDHTSPRSSRRGEAPKPPLNIERHRLFLFFFGAT